MSPNLSIEVQNLSVDTPSLSIESLQHSTLIYRASSLRSGVSIAVLPLIPSDCRASSLHSEHLIDSQHFMFLFSFQPSIPCKPDRVPRFQTIREEPTGIRQISHESLVQEGSMARFHGVSGIQSRLPVSSTRWRSSFPGLK